MQKYFREIEDKVRICYSIAEVARAKGLDPLSKVEIPIARSLAERVVGLISTIYPQLNDKKIVERIVELEKEHGKLDQAVSFKIAEEVAKEKFCKFEGLLQAIEAGIRLGFAYNTLGVVSSPIEGFTEFKLGKTREGKDYFKPYFSGPIRSAGTTAACMALILIDYLRELFGYAKYDPTELEVKRYVTENYDYHERITNLQYLPTEEEIEFLAKNLPIQIAGDPTEDREVSNYKDLERIETNFIRGGMCLIFSEGLAQKAPKALRFLRGLQKKGFKISGWEFLEEYSKLHSKREKGAMDTTATYIKDIVAGRPVLGHPSRSGTFRFRYGRSRVSGFSAAALHPATMAVSDGFLSIGTQLKIEKPTKGCVITACDVIDGPVVKLSDGSVKKIRDFEEGKKLYPDISEIIYFGDILFPLSDLINRNYNLIKPGYCEEWWEQELKAVVNYDIRQRELVDKFYVSLSEAIRISEEAGIPLHPEYIFYWTQINQEQFLDLLHFLLKGILREHRFILPYSKKDSVEFARAKRTLEILGVEHKVAVENIVIDAKNAGALFANLGLDYILLEKNDYKLDRRVNELIKKAEFEIKGQKNKAVLEIVNALSKYKIKDRAGTFIGARMGRPEKAKLRKLVGSPNVLFPVGDEGGRFRSVNEAVEVGSVKSDFPIYRCNKCNKETIYYICEDCGNSCEPLHYCKLCHQKFEANICPEHKIGQRYYDRQIDMKHFFNRAIKHLGLNKGEVPALVKGVRGTSNEHHIPEHLSKGILRARYGLCVNKDGTIRYDATETPITHFKPKEIGAPIEILKKLGYMSDAGGHPLENDNQILELKPHDILIPACPETLDERGDEVFIKIAQFIDELLVRFYNLKPFYNVRNREDLIGHLAVCISPHNCAGVIARIIGFSKTQTFFASPYIHAAVRRDCDGDELAITLLLDTILNFSRQYLPAHRGGTQDSPLVLNARIRAGEVDDQILDFETVQEYPLKLYEFAEEGGHHSSEIEIETVRQRLAKSDEAFDKIGYTHETNDFNCSIINSSYKILPTMQEKVRAQMNLTEKLRAVDCADVARLIIDRHFIRDLRGNLRKFSQQQFRCVNCNLKFRRPPLAGKCTRCNGKIIFTIAYGSIVKYLEPAIALAEKYNVPPYVKQTLVLAKKYIESIFGKETEKQEALEKWL